MDDPSRAAREAVTPLRIETGAGESRAIEPAAQSHWITPTFAAGAVVLGLALVIVGALRLRRRPRAELSPQELFGRVAKVMGATHAMRAEASALASHSVDGVPSAVGLLLSASARTRLGKPASGGAR